MLVVRDPVFFRQTSDTARWILLRDHYIRRLVCRHTELHGTSPALAEVRALEAAIFPGLKPMAEALMAPSCERTSRLPLLFSEQARQTGLDVSELLGSVLKPLHDLKRISERIYWASWEAAGVRATSDTDGEAVTLLPGKTAGQEAIKLKMKECLGKGMDGLLGRDWRQVGSTRSEPIVCRELRADGRCV